MSIIVNTSAGDLFVKPVALSLEMPVVQWIITELMIEEMIPSSYWVHDIRLRANALLTCMIYLFSTQLWIN